MRFAALFLMLVHTALADSPADPRPQVTPSNSGSCFFSILPPHYKDVGGPMLKVTRQPFGAAYELRDDGTLTKLWSVKGWYAFRVFLSDDGRYLVRMGDWPMGDKPSKDDLAVAFYDRGKLLKQYSTADLVKDHTKVRASVSHYRWLYIPKPEETDEILSYDNYEQKFHLKTIDGIRYIFDARTGNIQTTNGG